MMILRWKRQQLIDIGVFLLLGTAVLVVLGRNTAAMGYNWQWYLVPRYFFTLKDGVPKAGPFLGGILVTLEITAAGFFVTVVFGLTTAFLRLSKSPVGIFVARLYLELIRNTPLLVQLFLVYFIAAPVFGFGAFASAVLALGLFEGAYASEIIRGGILAVPFHQREAASALGLSSLQIYRHVILPQAVRNVLPALAGQGVSLVKDSALVSTIAIYDLTMSGRAIVADTFMTFEVWFTIAAVYLVLTLSLSAAVRKIEKRIQKRYT